MNEVQEALRVRYAHLHPLIFQRSLEKSINDGELFDILDSVPDVYPVVWDDLRRRWVHTEDIVQSDSFGEI